MKMGKSSKMWNGVWFAVAACSLMIPSQLEAGNSVNEVIAIDQAKIGVKGVVLDENGEPVPGANVVVKGATVGTITDMDGNFSLQVEKGATIVVSFIGYANKEVQINERKARYTVSLELETHLLDEVIVTGYQTISKERATGSFAVVTPKDMESKLQTNILDRMEGMVAGMVMPSNKSNPTIRGISTLNGTQTPLYVVDGVPYEGSLDVINPADIVNVTVLKDATAASIYGARSANGVIVITTRQGQAGKTRVNYSGSIKFEPLPSRDYYNYTSSAETVDLMEELFQYSHNAYQENDRRYTNEVYQVMYDLERGAITQEEYQKRLDYYRNSDRYDLVREAFLRRADITHQHNVSFNGGTDIYKYALSVNYQQNLPYEKAQKDRRLGLNWKNQFDFFKWLRVDVGIMNSTYTTDYDNGISGMSYLNGGTTYRMLRNPDGSPAQWYGNKSQYEIDRLNSLGLQDETYIPLNELDKSHYSYKSRYWNINVGANIKIWDGLSLDLRYQTEMTNTFNKQYDSKDANKVKSNINDGTIIDPKTGKVTNLMPVGGWVNENRGENNSYTLRAQLNYNKTFLKEHEVQVIVGAERRKVVTEGSHIMKVGYDDISLSYKKIDEFTLGQQQKGTESIFGSYSWSDSAAPFSYSDNRYVSFYGNASYTFNSRLTATGSVRIDQSNLFGTDPKYQYKPLWSAGAHYVILQNESWVDRLVGRITYGINGNVAKNSGPYMISENDSDGNYYTGESQSDITTPPNPTLRWEKTKVFNVAVDFNLFKGRLNGSLEFYNKATSDLLGWRATDPTFGWSRLMLNYGSMRNRGVEITLNSHNIQTKDFNWTSTLTFSYNKNMLTSIENSGTSAYSYYGSLQNREGYPMSSIFAIRYAGLSEDGLPWAYKADGTIVKGSSALEKEDLVYMGTTNPPYAASLSNRLTYKGFVLDFMFVFYGGHKLRDVAAGYQFTYYPVLNYTGAVDRDRLNFWRQPGDEKDPNMAPRFLYKVNGGSDASALWQYADKHIQKGDYIKLRDLSIGYTFPKEWMRKCYVENLRVSLQIQNLWYWAANDKGLDPEVWSGTSSSPSRGSHVPATYTLGVSLDF